MDVLQMNAVVFGAEVLDGCNSTSSKIHLAFSQFHSKSEAMTTEVQHLLKMKKFWRVHIWRNLTFMQHSQT